MKSNAEKDNVYDYKINGYNLESLYSGQIPWPALLCRTNFTRMNMSVIRMKPTTLQGFSNGP